MTGDIAFNFYLKRSVARVNLKQLGHKSALKHCLSFESLIKLLNCDESQYENTTIVIIVIS